MKYKRIIVKLSGEALADEKSKLIFNAKYLDEIAKTIKKMHDKGVEIGIVVGAGNIWRGKLASQIGIENATADYMGMLGTIINALAIQSALDNNGLICRVMSALDVNSVAEPYIRKRAIRHLQKGRIVIFAGGTGNPFFTTDTAAALRAIDIGAEAIFAAKNGVDGVYSDDPRKNPNAEFIKEISFEDVVSKNLQVMDQTSITMLIGKGIVIKVFNMANSQNFLDALDGKDVGTTIK